MLLSQPIRPGYRDLPIGTDDVAAGMPDDAVVLRWPVVRWSGLEPFSAIVRDPDEPSADPPVVPYHDLRTLAQAARSGTGAWDVEVSAETIRAMAQDGLAELRRREQEGTDVAVSDLLLEQGAEAMHTLNHPGNPVLLRLAERVLDELGEAGRPTDPGPHPAGDDEVAARGAGAGRARPAGQRRPRGLAARRARPGPRTTYAPPSSPGTPSGPRWSPPGSPGTTT